MKIIWTKTAYENLDSIVRYIAKDNSFAPSFLDNAIREAANKLSIFPYLGRKR